MVKRSKRREDDGRPHGGRPSWAEIDSRFRSRINGRLAAFRPARSGQSSLENDTRGLLNLSECDLSDVDAVNAMVQDHLVKLRGLTRLNMKYCHLNDGGVAIFAAHAGKLKSLTSIDLGYNEISAVGAAALAAGFAVLPKLTTLSISNNPLTDAGVRAIAEHGRGFESLITLGLRSVAALDSGLIALAEHAGDFTSLNSLDLSTDQITDAGIIALIRHIGNFKALSKLNLSGNQIRTARLIDELVKAAVEKRPGGVGFEQLAVDGNPLTFHKASGSIVHVPPEGVRSDEPKSLLAQLERYKPEKNTEEVFNPLYCLRATVLGQPAVGKSHLALRLTNGDKLPVDQTGTILRPKRWADWVLHTLPLEKIALTRKAKRSAHPITVELRLLDFGEPDLHSAHRLMLRGKRNFYIIVNNASLDRDASLLDYWMRVAHAYGTRYEVQLRAEDQQAKKIARKVPVAVVMSWADRGVHPEFLGVTGIALSRKHDAIVHLANGYWEPAAAGLGTLQGKAQFSKAMTRVRRAIEKCVLELADELSASYPKGFTQIIDLFDPVKQAARKKKTPLCDGPIPLRRVEAMFADATGHALDGRTGAELLCNLGLVVCPRVDADRAMQDWKRTGLPAGLMDAVDLTDDMVFGSQWLKVLIYKVVRKIESPLADEHGVVGHNELVAVLTHVIGGANAVKYAACVLALFRANRMIFPRDAQHETYLIAERLPQADARAIRRLNQAFDSAPRWELRPTLLLASHLPQFFGEHYAQLASDASLHSDIFREHGVLTWHEDPAIEAFLSVNLNQGTVDIAIRGASDTSKAERFAQAIADAWGRVFGERQMKLTSAGEVKSTPSAENKTSLLEWRRKAETFVEKHGWLPMPQYFFAWILGCSESSLSIAIHGTKHRNSDAWKVEPSALSAKLRARPAKPQTRQLGQPLLDSTQSTTRHVDAPVMLREQISLLSKMSKDEIIDELIASEPKAKRDLARERARSYDEDRLRAALAHRRLEEI